MMDPIHYIDRLSGEEKTEKVFGKSALGLLYGDSALSKLIGRPLNRLWARNPLFSSLYGCWQKQPWTKRNIRSFIADYDVEASEFQEPIDAFNSFNDFFIRKLKTSARPVAAGDKVAVIPADGRYLFFPDVDAADGFIVKGKKFNLSTFLENDKLAEEYRHGTMIIARLCPSDYHRFHFPCDCIPGTSELINGWLYSVNPIALKKDIEIFTQNKRAITALETTAFGKVLYIEVGATNVGSIHQTYTPHEPQAKGMEKGYFSFGASTLVLLFPAGSIQLDADLLGLAGTQGLEIKCLMGQSMGHALL